MEETLLENEPVGEIAQSPLPEAEPTPALPEEGEEGTADEATENATPSMTDEDYQKLEREDLEALKAQFPALSGLSSLCFLSDPVRYAELRDLGLSPAEAYLATGGALRKRSDNRAHLQSAVPRRGAVVTSALSSEQMAEARRLFSDLSDAQIHRLFKKVTN